MRFTPRLAKYSIAITAAVFVLVFALWIRSAAHEDAIIYQARDSNWSLVQWQGVITFNIPHDPVGGYVEQGFRYEHDDRSWMKAPEIIWWGRFSWCASFSGPFSPMVRVAIPHWFLLCLFSIFLLPAVIHWRMKETHAAIHATSRFVG